LKNLPILLIGISLWLGTQSSLAQGERQVLVLSGIVVDGKNSDPLPGVHMYIPKAGRGSTTNVEGFFAMSVMAGDSIVISSIGYKKRYFFVPKDKVESYSVVIEMTEDITNLPIIEVFPYPTEELFKEAFLALDLPDEEKMEALRENLNQQIMTRLALTAPMDAKMNYRNQMMNDVYRMENRNFMPNIQFLNPFAWARFFKSVKRGDFKKGKWKDKR
jgi:hypothetical protein